MSEFQKYQLVDFVQKKFNEKKDLDRAVLMAAYMKSQSPFYGVQKKGREEIFREVKKLFIPQDQTEYEEGVASLWGLSHREEKYMAISFARRYEKFITISALPLYERMIREGAWWDYVDDISANLVGFVYKKERIQVKPLMDKWIVDEHLWIRRSAILCQLRHKEKTNSEQLFDYCLQASQEKDFFIRKAIGWALREYSKSAPEKVLSFIEEYRTQLSKLSVREGLKHLKRSGFISMIYLMD